MILLSVARLCVRKVITSCGTILHNSIEDVLDRTDLTDGTFLGGSMKPEALFVLGSCKEPTEGHITGVLDKQRTWSGGTVCLNAGKLHNHHTQTVS